MVPGFICWLGFYPWNASLLARKLQMTKTISEHDRKEALDINTYGTPTNKTNNAMN